MKNHLPPDAKTITLPPGVKWRYCHDPQSGFWVAVCEPFKLTLQAASYPELLESIAEAINEVFSDLAQTDEIEDFLKEHGWRVDPLLLDTTPMGAD